MIGILLAIFIVPVVLNIMSGKITTESIEKFDMALPKTSFLGLGSICCVFFGGCLYGTISSGQSSPGTLGIFGSLFALGILLIIAPIKGFWGNSVDGDNLNSTRLWLFKKTIKISEIDHCVMTRGGLKIYLKGQKRKAMGVDSMAENIGNFMERMKKEGIPVEIQGVLNENMINTNQQTTNEDSTNDNQDNNL